MVKKRSKDHDPFYEDDGWDRPGGLLNRLGRALRRLVGFPLYLLELLEHSTGRFLRKRLAASLEETVWFLALPFRWAAAVARGATAFLWKRIEGPLAIVVWLLGFPLSVIGRVFVSLWIFVFGWIASRSYRSLLLGLPAVAGCLAVVVAVALAGRVSDGERLVRYRRLAARALNQGDSKAAELWWEKTTLLDPKHPVHQYGLALVAESDGRHEQARQLMSRIAPADDVGYPAAHIWLAIDRVRQEAPLSPEDERALEHHLQQALTEPPYRDQSHLLLAQLYLSRGEVKQAIRHSEQVVADRPELRISLARLYAQQKNTARAKSELEKAAQHFSRLVQDEPDNVPAWLLWAESQILLGQLPRAEAILRTGLQATDDPRFSAALARLYLVQFDQLWKQNSTQRDRALVLLQAAAESAPDDPRVLDRLHRLAFPADSHRQAVQQLLRQSVVRGGSAALAHVLLAITAAEEDNLETATMHYRLGFQQSPAMIELPGNLARHLLQMDPPQAERALRLTETALQAIPDHPVLREARDEVLAELGRGEEPTTINLRGSNLTSPPAVSNLDEIRSD